MLECILALQKHALKHKRHKNKHVRCSLLCGNVVHGHKVSDIFIDSAGDSNE